MYLKEIFALQGETEKDDKIEGKGGNALKTEAETKRKEKGIGRAGGV